MRVATLRVLLASLAVLPLLVVALAVYLARSIARPLALIGEGASRIAGGDLGARVALAGKDEFGTLAAELNEMAGSLKRHQEELVRSGEAGGPRPDGGGDRARDQQPAPGDDRLPHPAPRARPGRARQAPRPGRARGHPLQGDRGGAAPAPARPPRSCRSAWICATWPTRWPTPSASGSRRPRRTSASRGAASRTERAGQFRQVVYNLAKNAAEAAGPRGAVEIRVSDDGPIARVAVSDTGPGIAPDLRERIFEPFFTTKPTGTGLGLALARAIAGALGGDIEVDRSEVGGARSRCACRGWKGQSDDARAGAGGG